MEQSLEERVSKIKRLIQQFRLQQDDIGRCGRPPINQILAGVLNGEDGYLNQHNVNLVEEGVTGLIAVYRSRLERHYNNEFTSVMNRIIKPTMVDIADRLKGSGLVLQLEKESLTKPPFELEYRLTSIEPEQPIYTVGFYAHQTNTDVFLSIQSSTHHKKYIERYEFLRLTRAEVDLEKEIWSALEYYKVEDTEYERLFS